VPRRDVRVGALGAARGQPRRVPGQECRRDGRGRVHGAGVPPQVPARAVLPPVHGAEVQRRGHRQGIVLHVARLTEAKLKEQ
jgi:hypothetical protein